MENIYLILVVILFALAISDLIVGVSNDAVNFLNSAIGAKAAPFKVLMGIAALGVLFGTTFSSGMMEVARKGIFHPEHFYFSEIMIIFLAVMITDIILLDTFNTFGMPTSTTVSIVFELLGAAVSVAVVKLNTQPEAIMAIAESLGLSIENINIQTFINTNKAILIISGILLSVVVAFSIGALVQYLSRLLLSFEYKTRLKYFGALWGGFAITAITYFILIKGLKGSTYATYVMSDGTILKKWVITNAFQIIIVTFVGWVIILQILQMLKVNILKVIVFVGTFAVAMAFASNDLVNFIGVPLAGYHAFMDWSASDASASTHLMSGLTGKVPTEFYLLLIAGFIMVITLWFSKKAKSVVKTSLDLSRQDDGDERFGSSVMARNMVRAGRKASKGFKKILPEPVNNYIDKQFDQTPFKKIQALKEQPAEFDLIRASVNLVVASILISIGTANKLPLSTTYVTFMVAMGTSLADRAWSKESAVFRITGVISVIGGWFFTAFSAFSVAFLVALAFSYGGFYAIFGLLAVVLFVIYKTHSIHKKRVEKQARASTKEVTEANVLEETTNNITESLNNAAGILDSIVNGLEKQDRRLLKETHKDVKVLNKQAKYLKDNVGKAISKFDKDSIRTSHFYVQVLDYLRETAHNLYFISKPSLEHVENEFGELLETQITELNSVARRIRKFYKMEIDIISTQQYEKIDEAIAYQQKLIVEINDYRVLQIKRVKHKEAGTKNSMLYLGILHETKNLLLNGVNLLKSQRDFNDFKYNK